MRNTLSKLKTDFTFSALNKQRENTNRVNRRLRGAAKKVYH